MAANSLKFFVLISIYELRIKICCYISEMNITILTFKFFTHIKPIIEKPVYRHTNSKQNLRAIPSTREKLVWTLKSLQFI